MNVRSVAEAQALSFEVLQGDDLAGGLRSTNDSR
jgi:hypothetical protein